MIWTGEIPEQKADLAILDRLDAISAQLTQHLQWKTPICPPAEPELEGEWRKISFRSDEVSPYGTNRLRKYLRYRSVSGLGLGNSSTTGRPLRGLRERLASDIPAPLGGLLKSGPLHSMKESGSYSTLLEKRALIRLKLVDGQVVLVAVPDSECPY